MITRFLTLNINIHFNGYKIYYPTRALTFVYIFIEHRVYTSIKIEKLFYRKYGLSVWLDL